MVDERELASDSKETDSNNTPQTNSSRYQQTPDNGRKGLSSESTPLRSHLCGTPGNCPFGRFDPDNFLRHVSVSPSVFAVSDNEHEPVETVDYLSLMRPVEIEASPSMLYPSHVTASVERRCQQNISLYFTNSKICPSPWSNAGSATRSTNMRQCDPIAEEQPRTVATQTTLTIPPYIDLSLLLSAFMKYDDRADSPQNMSMNSAESSALQSSLRRKLFPTAENYPEADAMEGLLSPSRMQIPPLQYDEEDEPEITFSSGQCCSSPVGRNYSLDGQEPLNSSFSSITVSPIRNTSNPVSRVNGESSRELAVEANASECGPMSLDVTSLTMDTGYNTQSSCSTTHNGQSTNQSAACSHILSSTSNQGSSCNDALANHSISFQSLLSSTRNDCS